MVLFILSSSNHIFIGLLYMLFGFFGGSLGWGLSIMMSLELGLPGFVICSSFGYNSVMSFHGIFMISFMMMPLLIGGFGNLLIPLMLCSSDMMFPRLNALSVWLVIDSLFMVLFSLFLDGGVNAGWTFYVPLSIINYYSIDLMFFSLHLVGLSSLFGSINFMVTLLKACNLSIVSFFFSLPLFSLSMFLTSFLLLISLPVLAACITMVIFDRHFNGSFFDIFRGGDVLLFQHLFWFFGHPEAYILILPGFGLISEILSKFSQCIIFARDSMLLALFIIGSLGCIVWGHHMFIVGFDIDTSSYFTSATSIIAIPTAMKLLNWWATVWSGCCFWMTPLFFMFGFMSCFSLGGFTGLILANCMIDTLLHDSYFVVSHSHYVLSLGALYSFFGGFFNFGCLFGFGSFNYLVGWLFFVMFLLFSSFIFFSMHFLGLFGFASSCVDYYVYYFGFMWFSLFGLCGIILSVICFIYSLF